MCGSFGTYSAVDALPNALAAGNVTEATIMTAFERLMRIRMRLGMFDPPSMVAPNNASYTPQKQSETSDKVELARRAAREGTVLLQNKDSALPLSKQAVSGGEILVVGPQVIARLSALSVRLSRTTSVAASSILRV